MRAAGLRIVLAGAQTGGHLYPAVAVGRRLVAEGAEVTLVASGEAAERSVLKDAGLPVEILKVGKLKGMGLGARLRGVASLPAGFWRAAALLRRLRPSLVAGFGGFTSGPLVLTAQLLGIPTVVFEANSVPGMTNRILARLARRFLTTFDETAARVTSRQVVRTGTPIRPEVAAVAPKRYGDRARRVLVFGGSQGSAFLNARVPPVLARVAGRLGGLEVRHQTGIGRDVPVREAYREAGLEADVVEYLHGMADAYAWADFVVARSGAGTVSEVAAIGIPALFVPFALAADDHQAGNARPLVAAGAARMVEEREFDEARVADDLAGLLADPARLGAMAEASRAWGVRDAVDRVAGEMMAVAAR